MNIITIYQDIIAKLSIQGMLEPISANMLKMKKNYDRVQFLSALLHDLNMLPKLLEVTKSESVSTYYRNLGNQEFQKGKYYEAWQYYNLSLLNAPDKTDNYVLAIANRSAVLFSLKKYRECLIDIEKVFATQYPEKLKGKLIKRQTQCKQNLLKEIPDEYITKSEEIELILKMKSPHHPIYLCASSKLDVVQSESMGRHVIAKEDIAPGEVIVKEKPYLTLLLGSQLLFSCSYCLSRSSNLYPCNSCCFALYCSDECKNQSWKHYHEIECPMMPSLIEMKFTKIELLALRTVIKAHSDYDSWETLYKVIEETDSHLNTEFQGQVKIDGKWVYDSKYYPSIHSLATNIDKRCISNIFQKSLSAAVFVYMLRKQTNFLVHEKQEQSNKIVECVSNLMLHHLMTSPTNMHGISSNCEDVEGNCVEEMGLASAPYAFLSLLNHSCSPNVVRCYKLGSGDVTLLALRPIKKGMQLFDNYGYHHAVMDRVNRQNSLNFQYHFTCSCEACVNNWPMYLGLKPARNLERGVLKSKETLLSPENIEKLQKGNIETALKLFKPLSVLLAVLENYAPCIELADCQESFKQCEVILNGLISHGYTKLVQWKVQPLEEN